MSQLATAEMLERLGDAPRNAELAEALAAGLPISRQGVAKHLDVLARDLPFGPGGWLALLKNPDLVDRFRRNAPLNTPDVTSFYGGTEKGYTDYSLVGV